MEAIEVYQAFIAFLERDLKLQGPWPDPKRTHFVHGGSSYLEYKFNFNDFPGIRMRRGMRVWTIEINGYCKGRTAKISDLMPCINFVETGTEWGVGCVNGTDASELRRKLHEYIAVDDVLRVEDVQRAFISFLEDDLQLKGPWPQPTRREFGWHLRDYVGLLLRFDPLPGIQICDEHTYDGQTIRGSTIERVEMRGYVEDKYGMCKASIRFYGVGLDHTDRFWADGLTAADLRSDLRKIVFRVDGAEHIPMEAETVQHVEDAHRVFLSFLEDDLKLQGPWPKPTVCVYTENGREYEGLLLSFQPLPVIKMRGGRTVDRVEMHPYVWDAYGCRYACFKFYGVGLDMAERNVANGLTAGELRANLRKIVCGVDPLLHRVLAALEAV
jgi:hypothetical protein